MKKTDKFLELYREFETVLRDQGIDYKVLEDNAEDMLQNRLRICRQMRNYLTHNHDVGFLEISDSQIKFMEKLINDQKMNGDVLKKYLRTVKSASCLITDKCVDVIAKMLKLKVEYMPVCDSNGVIGLVSVYDVISTIFENTKAVKVSSVKKLVKKVQCMKPDVSMDYVLQYSDEVICCTDSGEMQGKLLGVYYSD